MLLLLNFASVAVDPTVTLANGVVMPRVACGTGGLLRARFDDA